MSNPEKDQAEQSEETLIEDLDVDADNAAGVAGGDARYTATSNVMKTKHDTFKNSISNVR
jgi:hypothetical protein